MNQLSDDIRYLTRRALWETDNLIACVPDGLWNKRYDGIPMWKYVYHTLFSMDRWFINPKDPGYVPPEINTPDRYDLNVEPPEDEILTRRQIDGYFAAVKAKIEGYIDGLTDDMLSEFPENCDMSRMLLILGQFRHWHRHMGIIYGFIVEDTGKWPYVLNMHGRYPGGGIPAWYE